MNKHPLARGLSALLAALMLFSLLALPTFAADATENTPWLNYTFETNVWDNQIKYWHTANVSLAASKTDSADQVGQLAFTADNINSVYSRFAMSQWNLADVEDYVVQIDLLVSSGSKGNFVLQLMGSDANASFSYTDRIIQPFIIKATGDGALLDINTHEEYTSGGAVGLDMDKWYTLTAVIDKETSVVSVYLNGMFVFSQKNSFNSSNTWLNTGTVGGASGGSIRYFKANSFYFYHQAGDYAAEELTGYVQFDDLKLYNSTKGLGLKNNTLIDYTFETNVWENQIKYWYTANVSLAASKTDSTDQVGQLAFTADNINSVYSRFAMPQWNLADVEDYVVQIDLLVSSGSKGNFVLQLMGSDANASFNYTDRIIQPFIIKATGDEALLDINTHEEYTRGGAVSLDMDKWYTVTAVIDKETSVVSVYLDGAFAFSQKNSFNSSNTWLNTGTVGGASGGSIRYFKANSFYFYHQAGDYAAEELTGYVQFDDLKLHNSTLTLGLDKEIVLDNSTGLMYVLVGGEKIYSNRFRLPAGESYTPVYFDGTPYEGLLTTEDANSIRLAKEAGLRFASRVDMTRLDALLALVESGELASVEIGHMIAPADYIRSDFTVAAFESEGNLYMTVPATIGKYYSFDSNPDTTHIVGSIVNLYEHNISRDFAGRGYVKVTTKTGSEVMLYSDTIRIDDVQSVANRVLEQGTDGYNDAQLNILNLFSQGLQPPLSDSAAKRDQDLNHLNVLAIGDSLFDGHSVAADQTWLALLAQKYHWNLTNLGWDGWTVAKHDASYAPNEDVRASMYDYLMKRPDIYCYGGDLASYTYGNPAGVAASEVDLILLEGGTNDYGWSLPLGDTFEDSLSKGDNYIGALNQIIIKLKTMYPNAKIVMVSAWHNEETHWEDGTNRMDFTVNGMKLLKNTVYADDNAVFFMDAGDPALNGGIRMDLATFRATYACAEGDVNHLNAEGMKLMAANMPDLIWQTVFQTNKQTDDSLAEKEEGITRVVCVGDSITEYNPYWENNMLGKLDASYEVIGLGVSGSTALASGIDANRLYGYALSEKYELSLRYSPDIVVMMLGTNDTKPVNSDRIYADNGAQFKKDMTAMVEAYKSLASDPTVYIALPCTIYRERESGSGINDTDLVNLIIPLLREVAEATGAKVIDVHTATQGSEAYFTDGVHPTGEEGRDLIASAIAAAINADRA